MPEPDWSRISTNNGYPFVYCPDHPNANAVGYIFVHRYVMEKKLGRFLGRDEIVHHVNEDKTDYRIENLELTNRSAHAKHHRRYQWEIRLTCPTCHNPFWRVLRQTHFVKGGAATFCSRTCNGSFHHSARNA